jgi:hypothetical protein
MLKQATEDGPKFAGTFKTLFFPEAGYSWFLQNVGNWLSGCVALKSHRMVTLHTDHPKNHKSCIFISKFS